MIESYEDLLGKIMSGDAEYQFKLGMLSVNGAGAFKKT